MSWPAPHRISVSGLETFGYEDQVVFPIALRPQTPGQPIVVNAQVSYLACSEICIPRNAQLSLELPAGTTAPTDHAQLINRFLAQVPGDGARQGLRLDHVALGYVDGQRVLEVEASSAIAPFEKPDIIVEAPTGLYFGPPANSKIWAVSGVWERTRNSAPHCRQRRRATLSDAALTLTLVDGVRGLEQKVVAGVGIGRPAESSSSASSPALPASSIVAMLLVRVARRTHPERHAVRAAGAVA